MPWNSNSSLPDGVKNSLPAAAQTRWREVANAALSRGESDESAARQAWHVVKQGWEKNEDGEWVRKAGGNPRHKPKGPGGGQFTTGSGGGGDDLELPDGRQAVVYHVTIPGHEDTVQSVKVRFKDGMYHGDTGEFDFETDKAGLLRRLKQWKATTAGYEKRTGERTLYVRRDVTNAADLVKWAKAQGFTTTLPADDMHVTVAYSKKPVEWGTLTDHFDNLTIKGGSDRSIEQFDKGAVVLTFASGELTKRWEEFKGMGAVWKWDDYSPHVTITYDAPEDLDLAKVEAYSGDIVLGPEIFEEIDSDWHDNITEKAWYLSKRVSELEKITKRGARHTRGEYQQLQDMHDLCVSLGAKCSPDDDAMKSIDVQSFDAIEYHKYDSDGNEVEKSSDEQPFLKTNLLKYSDNLGLCFGWAIVCKENGEDYFDTQGDNIDEGGMLEAAADFMMNSRMSKDMHTGDQDGSVVFCWPMTKEIADAMGITTKRTGLMIAMKPSTAVAEKFRSGEYTGFSIGGNRIEDKAA